MSVPKSLSITHVQVYDIRFPTSLEQHGTDALHVDPEYSCAYVVLTTNENYAGHGFTFTIGRGTEIVVKAIESMSFLVAGQSLLEIIDNFGQFWHSIVCESQLRWLGPEKGVTHLATAAIVNAIWDLWAKVEQKPLWKLVADMKPEEIVNCIDFQYISDSISPEDAVSTIASAKQGLQDREKELIDNGIPAYITSVGWLGYTNDMIKKLCTAALSEGWQTFKMKVGNCVDDDRRRASLIRSLIGPHKRLMMDANQRWSVDEAIANMKQMAEFKPMWIEEPTSPDDILGHKAISEALKPYGIGVATGEHCQNRTMFKQFLSCGAMQYCQIDACRVGGVNEILAILLLAKKYNVPVCPHAGGVGLCELVVHLAAINYLNVSPSLDNICVEYVDHLHEHFVEPTVIKNAKYMLPQKPGYAEMIPSSIAAYSYPTGSVWQKLFADGTYPKPN